MSQVGPSRRTGDHKGVNLALQGGGAHGAYTWGVLDRLFEDDRIWIESLSGTSAGAMNAVVAANGMAEGGADGAREHLTRFWTAVSRAALASPLRRSPLAALFGEFSLIGTPAYTAFDIAGRLASPYDLNPLGINPLRDLVEDEIDFEKVRAIRDMNVFVGATNAETGLGRVFNGRELTVDMLMASACLPSLFKAVVIDDAPYWDGGFSGNPPLYPFLEECKSEDILIVQINPIMRPGIPRRAHEISNRVNEVTFNSSLLHEMRAIHMVNRMIERGEVVSGARRHMRFHIVTARKRMRELDASSKLNAQWAFLRYLFEIGRESASRWLDHHFDDIGERSTVDVEEMLSGEGAPSLKDPPLPEKSGVEPDDVAEDAPSPAEVMEDEARETVEHAADLAPTADAARPR